MATGAVLAGPTNCEESRPPTPTVPVCCRSAATTVKSGVRAAGPPKGPHVTTESPREDGDGARLDPSGRRPTDHQQAAATTTTAIVTRQATAEEYEELRRLLGGRKPVHRTTLQELGFRRWQAGWRRRIAFSRRCAPYDVASTSDPLAPSGRWGE